ncbi:formimidoylglutamase [Nostoc sp. NIES-2111]
MYIPADRAAWRARLDGPEPDVWRWHQVVKLHRTGTQGIPALPAGAKGIALMGFASDEGVVRNLGRVGAVEGPQMLRQFCAGLPVHFDAEQNVMLDLGTVVCQNQNLEEAQEELGALNAAALAAGYRTLILGGGHEVTYAHWLGTRTRLSPGQTAGIINFDAHYDLRDLDPELGRHSGNSFTAMAADCAAEGRPFAYAALGIQRTGNTRRLFNRAAELGAVTIFGEEMGGGVLAAATERLGRFIADHQPSMLTIDMDVFSASLAPGVSAPNAIGILPGPAFMSLLRQTLHAPCLRSVDVAELNPRYDLDNRTARLGAALCFETVQAWVG